MEGNFILPAVKNPQSISFVIECEGNINPSPTLTHTKLPHNHTVGFLPFLDDGDVNDKDYILKYLQGEQTGFGETYPLWTFSDGCGNQLPAKFSYALNANDGHNIDSGNINAPKWPDLELCFNKQTEGNPIIIGHRLLYPTNHGLNHAGPDIYNEVVGNAKRFWEKFGLLVTTGVVPGADKGYAATGPVNFVPIWFSEWGVIEMRDGYTPMIKYFPTISNLYRQLCTRYYTGTNTTLDDVAAFTSFVNTHYSDCTGIGDAIGYFPYFFHGYGNGGSLANFHSMRLAITNHANYANAGIYTAQEALDYEVVRRGVFVETKIQGNKMYVYLSYSGIDRHLVYLNASFIVQGLGSSIVDVTLNSNIPDAQIKFNPTTGLINLYAENPFLIDPNTDPILPEIESVTALGTTISITYSMPVNQSLSTGYTIVDYTDPENLVDNPIISLTGSGATWTIECTNSVTVASKLFYRLQNGNAVSLTGKILCNYEGINID